MISFKQYCEAFNLFSSRYARGGKGNSERGSGVSNKSNNSNLLGSPKQVSTPFHGDTSGFSGMDQLTLKNKKPVFAYKINKVQKEGNTDYVIQIGLKGHMDYTNVMKTAFGQYIETDTFAVEKEAQEVLKRLRTSIDSVEVDS